MNSAAFALLLIGGIAYGQSPEWTSLKVTYSFDPTSPWGFAEMPLDLNGDLGGFHFRDDQCKVGKSFLGQRYWYKDDPSISLLFDTKGIIAGMQTSIAKSDFTPPAVQTNRQFLDDGDYWTITAYFVDPNIICGQGRTPEDLKKEGTGTGLWLQNGPDPIKDSVLIPMNEADLKNTAWTPGKCFKTQGMHYWYNVTETMSCDNFLPNCLMYNGGRLNVFCFAPSTVLSSPRFEHPTAEHASGFIDPVQDCFFDPDYNLSTIHVYFINDHNTAQC